MIYYDYKTKNKIEVKENKGLGFLYDNVFGRIILKIMVSDVIAKIYATYMNSIFSKYKINSFIRKNHINIEEYEKCDYKSFNEFFIRKIKKDKRIIEDGNIAVCDAKLSVYKINENLSLNIKNSIYTIEELIQEKADEFQNGYACVYRLAVDDYHHYIYPDDGKVVFTKKIKGILHTVQPIAFKKYKVFCENSRQVTIIDTQKCGKIAYIEVGAMMIGKIVNNDVKEFIKGDEKGHFEFGGSTIILLYQKDKLKINNNILKNTENDIETIVKMGENIE